MPDEQLKELTAALKKRYGPLFQKWPESVLGTLVIGVVVGFFTRLRNITRDAEEEITRLQDSVSEIRSRSRPSRKPATVSSDKMNLRPNSPCGRSIHTTLLLVCIAAGVLVGCSGPGRLGGIGWTDKSGIHHTVVLGFGMVSHTHGPVTAVDVRGVGLVIDRGLSLGLVQRHEVAIDPAAAGNVVVSVNATPLTLTVKNYDFRPTNFVNTTCGKRKEPIK